MGFFRFRILAKRFGAILFMMKDKTVKWYKKALIIAGIIYLFLPFDLIPGFIPGAGMIDDILAWVLILYYLRDELDKYWMGDKSVDLSKKYRNAVNDVEYSVDDDKEEGGTSGGN